MAENKERCCARVFGAGAFHSYQCLRFAVVYRDGRGYCRQHDPIEVELRRNKQRLAYKRKVGKERRKYERLKLIQEYCKGMSVAQLKKGIREHEKEKESKK